MCPVNAHTGVVSWKMTSFQVSIYNTQPLAASPLHLFGLIKILHKVSPLFLGDGAMPVPEVVADNSVHAVQFSILFNAILLVLFLIVFEA